MFSSQVWITEPYWKKTTDLYWITAMTHAMNWWETTWMRLDDTGRYLQRLRAKITSNFKWTCGRHTLPWGAFLISSKNQQWLHSFSNKQLNQNRCNQTMCVMDGRTNIANCLLYHFRKGKNCICTNAKTDPTLCWNGIKGMRFLSLIKVIGVLLNRKGVKRIYWIDYE